MEQVRLGSVSAYVMVSSGIASIVDTGNPGSEGDIEAVLSEVGLRWDDVASMIVTHLHPDHQGSVPAVMNLASAAVGYAGEADLAAISSPRPLVALVGGEVIDGLQIVATPGHTPGHVSVYDPAGGALIAGDSLIGSNDGTDILGPSPRFTQDMSVAEESVRLMAGLQPSAIYVGHGEPLLVDAAGKLAALAASL